MRVAVAGTMALMLAACGGDAPSIADSNDGFGSGEAPDLSTPIRTDVVVQVTKPQVDVLWVVDDSCSMIEEQTKLATNFDKFIRFFLDSGLDWHIGLVSTDTDAAARAGKLVGAGGYRYIDSKTPDPTRVFASMTQLGTGGAFTEKGLEAAQLAIQQPTQAMQRANQGFYREDAALHVVVVSDEDDQSAPAVNRFEFIDFMRSLKDDADIPVTFSSIVGPGPSGCSNADTDADPGITYIAVTNAVGGIFESICEEDWVPVLEDLGLQAAGLRREYFLSEVPVPGTVEVWIVDGSYQADGVNVTDIKGNNTIQQVCKAQNKTACFPFEFVSERNSVILTDFVPSPLAEVSIRYEVLSGLQDAEDVDFEGGGKVDTGL